DPSAPASGRQWPRRLGRGHRLQRLRGACRRGRCEGDRRRRPRRGGRLLRHRRQLLARRQRGAAGGGAEGPARGCRGGHEVRDGHGGPQRTRPRCPGLAALRPSGGRGIAAPARHRLRRPLPAAPAGPGHPGRGDARGAAGAGHRGQGPLPGVLELRGVGGHPGALGGPEPEPAGLRHRPERVLPLQPGRRGRARACVPCRGCQPAAVLPARLRPAHRQVRRRLGSGRQPAQRGVTAAPARGRRLRTGLRAAGVRRRAGARPPLGRHRRACGATGCGQRDRGGEPAGAGAHQRGGRGVGALGVGPRRAGDDQPHAAAGHDAPLLHPPL
ncbi:MAG: Oxidoreductase, partial [uncultured Nocardioidaceae bacterium]